MNKTRETIRFKYTANVEVMHQVMVAVDATVLVVGDPENAAYEWMIERDGYIVQHSDAAYGSDAVALRDGLNVWLGDA